MDGSHRPEEERARERSQASLWRSIAASGTVAVYAAVLIVVGRADYRHLGWAWAVLAGMAAWTAFTSAAYAVPARRTRLLLAADLPATALASTALLQYPGSVAKAAMPVTATWVAGPVLAWAVAGGIRAGVVAALVLGACDLTLRHQSLAGRLPEPGAERHVLLLAGWPGGMPPPGGPGRTGGAAGDRDRVGQPGAGSAGTHDSRLGAAGARHGAAPRHRDWRSRGRDRRLAGEQEAALRALMTADDHAVPRPGNWTCSTLLTRETRPRIGSHAGGAGSAQ